MEAWQGADAAPSEGATATNCAQGVRGLLRCPEDGVPLPAQPPAWACLWLQFVRMSLLPQAALVTP